MIEIRDAVPADAPAISRIALEVQRLHAAALPSVFKPAGPDTFPPPVIEARMTTPGHRFWVAVEDGAVVGYVAATVQHEPESPWKHAATVCTLDQMGVAEHRRGCGAGAKLVDAVRTAAAAAGATEVRLNVWSFNEGARAFYARCGFVETQARLWLSTE
ncbi:GCN5-related N-acetyltransferase [Gemmatirosa kalamazoonensis]|uniref:GCN5-related N-acetyltransferase n=1 Tax=Gemmatirosa kalamazoonensis TaxID=861299 RepID=W0RCV4_9BACT|nr:GNAT family N-acetyltransferase [Gemmatirosa kalamazoonensis]AHG88155.1 GCN5-related N-acetyltransferase [Gemmatirosa kalamazoonensis]